MKLDDFKSVLVFGKQGLKLMKDGTVYELQSINERKEVVTMINPQFGYESALDFKTYKRWKFCSQEQKLEPCYMVG